MNKPKIECADSAMVTAIRNRFQNKIKLSNCILPSKLDSQSNVIIEANDYGQGSEYEREHLSVDSSALPIYTTTNLHNNKQRQRIEETQVLESNLKGLLLTV
eukprot:NODE_8_length_47770_cov_0.334354.p25 type:complete len:102 gc:universal NODE_8_length_47770_cov_0.334354:6774-7079(+)